MASTFTPVANFASGLGKYDSSLVNTGAFSDAAGNVGTSDLSLNTGSYLVNNNPNVVYQGTGNGFSITGWFNPLGGEAANATPIVDISTNSNYQIVVCCSGTSVEPCLSAAYNNVWIQSPITGTYGTLSLNAWNFFCYTVCCSGNMAVQNLYVNGISPSVSNPTVATSTAATYDLSLQFLRTMVAYGITPFANSFVGKLDDFRFYNRVITPMEYRVLYGYSYGKTGVAALIPALGSVSMGTAYLVGAQPAQPFTFSTTGTFSYLQVARTSGGVTATFYVSAGALTLAAGGAAYTWTDRSVFGGTQYSYTFTPFILGVPGGTSATYVSITPVAFNMPISYISYAGTAQYVYSAAANGILTNTSVYNGYTFYNYAFLNTASTYIVNYSCYASTRVYMLVVGGGGGGAGYTASGGGGGGVVMMPFTVPSGSGTITINVGAGGSGSTNNANPSAGQTAGYNTTVSFSNPSINSLVAYGGAVGVCQGQSPTLLSANGTTCGSGSGSGWRGGAAYIVPSTANYNFTNPGGPSNNPPDQAGGGGGAGSPGSLGINPVYPGSGLQCTLPGISTFTPSGYAPFGTYYWGAGGAGAPRVSNPGSGANGAANTGAGGAGVWTAYTGGAGGSGIVVLSIPQTSLASDVSAIMTPLQLTDASNIPVMSNPALSATAYQSVKGAFSCKLVNASYFGPTMLLRYSTDTIASNTQNFYADVYGNLFTGYGNTGISITSWLTANGANTTYAYVVKWYNQGMNVDFGSATQYTLGSQPIYDVANQLINFGDTNAAHGVAAPQNGYFNLPDSTFPGLPLTGTNDTSYSFVVRHGATNSTSTMAIYSAGANVTGTANSLILNNPSSGYYYTWWSGYDYQSGASQMANNNVVSTTYVSTGTTTPGTRALYVNGVANGTSVGTAVIHQQSSLYNYFGYCNYTGYAAAYQFQLYDIFYFSTALTPADRQLIENTPYVASTAMTSPAGGHNVGFYAPPAGSPITISGISFSYPFSSILVNGTSVTNNITYNVYTFTTVGTYIITYVRNTDTLIYVLAVGGGGGGGNNGGGGGGGGGVVMNPVLIKGSGTITITVGSGGSGVNTSTTPVNGSNTTVNFSSNPSSNIIAWGGGSGGNQTTNAGYGGSGGGAGYNYGGLYLGGSCNNNNNNHGNNGANGLSGGTSTSYSAFAMGGGGAGSIPSLAAGTNNSSGGTFSNIYTRGNGGNGIQCGLPGISTFAPNGTAYGTYYWGGGGGGASNSTAYSGYAYGNAGLGGGGGGAAVSGNNLVQSSGGGSALNAGANGGVSNGSGGSGGTSTGGGGGGGWTGTSSGSGGSGIVIIAFPQTAITSNAQAVLTTSQLNTVSYKDVLTNQGLSDSAYQSIKGAFACRLINYNYFGPIMLLRHSADPGGIYAPQAFYADTQGNFGTSYLGTGTSLQDWLNQNAADIRYAYVVKWFDQGMDICFNNAIQYTLGSQPIFDWQNSVINFGYTGTAGGVNIGLSNCFLNLPNTAIPYGDSSYSYVFRLWNFSGSNNYFVWGGTNAATGNANAILYNGTQYNQVWQGNDLVVSAANTANTVIAAKYTAGSNGLRYLYINDASNSGSGIGARQQLPTNNYIQGNNSGTGYGNAQMYNLYIFASSLNDSDRVIIQNTPTTVNIYPNVLSEYANPGGNVSISSITSRVPVANSTILSGTSVSNSYTYNCYAFLSSSTTYQLSYSCNTATRAYILAVGGGGAGGSSIYNSVWGVVGQGGGGGGGGGVVMMPITIPSGNGTMTIIVANGGAASMNINGGTSAVLFSNPNIPSVLALGGGAGGSTNASYGNAYTPQPSGYTPTTNWNNSTINAGCIGASNGGSNLSGNPSTYMANTSMYNNFGNVAFGVQSGGGGAGTQGCSGQTSVYIAGKGGNGLRCYLPGISNFTPSGYATFNTYYWGGGGGPGYNQGGIGYSINGYIQKACNGGLGGGGGGSCMYVSSIWNNICQGDTNGISPGVNGGVSSAPYGGNGGQNTGGGGGGAGGGNSTNGGTLGGTGGSGIVVISIPQVAVATDVSAIYTSTQWVDPSNIPVLNNPALSSSATQSIKCALAFKLLNASYFGPTVCLCLPWDGFYNTTQNFYADVYGNLYTGYGNTGMSVQDWLNANYTTSFNSTGSIAFHVFNGTGGLMYDWTATGTVTSVTNNTVTNSNTTSAAVSTAALTFSSSVYYGNMYKIGTFLGKTLLFDVYSASSICGMCFACNSSGVGNGIVINTNSSGYSGFGTTTSFTSNLTGNGNPVMPTAANGNGTVASLATNTWYSVKVVISASGLARWYLSTTGQAGNFTPQPPYSGFQINNNGTYAGLYGDGTNTNYFTGIRVFNNSPSHASITKWYNQGMDICFNSPWTNGSMGTYDAINQCFYSDFSVYNNFDRIDNACYFQGAGFVGTQGGFYITQGALPFGNSNYSYVYRLGNTPTAALGYQGGIVQASGFAISNYGSSTVVTIGASNVTSSNSTQNMVITTTYNGATESIYTNGGALVTATYTNRTQGATTGFFPANFVGFIGGPNNYLFGQMYNLMWFSTTISPNDQSILENTPFSPSTFSSGNHALSIANSTSAYNVNVSSITYSYPLIATINNSTSTYNGITYNVYTFTQIGGTYTINYTCAVQTMIYILAVGGGGGGGAANSGGSGGGGGGVVMNSVLLQKALTSQTISVTVGIGGSGGFAGTYTDKYNGWNACNGGNSTVTFNAFGGQNITAMGGGAGGMSGAGTTTLCYAPPTGGASSGGGTVCPSNTTVNYPPNTPNTSGNNFANQGGTWNNYSPTLIPGGGGAGTAGSYNSSTSFPGNGIQCGLPGIGTFAPNGTAYGTYYWGGGGGGTPLFTGGLGGGGSGLNSSYTSSYSSAAQGGINVPTTGIYFTSSAGAPNTGGGGGGHKVTSGYGGNGGSGIVIISIPQTVVASNSVAVVPSTTIKNDVWTTTGMGSITQSNAKGAFACRLINYNYFGPILTLRYSSDVCGNYTANFYADVCGNLGTQYLGTGTSVANWLYNAGANTTYAYVTKWYSQSMDICFNSATQYTLGSQPIYDVANGVLNFGYQGAGGEVNAPQTNAYLNLPQGAVPFNDQSFTITMRLLNTNSNGWLFGAGATNTNQANTIASNSTGFGITWYSNDLTVNSGTNPAYTIFTEQYTTGANGYRYVYVNGTEYKGGAGAARQQVPTGNFIMAQGASTTVFTPTGYGNSQLYDLFMFSSAIGTTDRGIVEATPYLYSLANAPATYPLSCTLPPAGSNILISSITYPLNLSSTLVSGTSVTNGITYYNYAFLGVGLPYVVTYTCTAATRIYVLAVGGGGGGSSYGGAGGGGGGVVMMPVTLPSGSGTMTITVGPGGIAGFFDNNSTTNPSYLLNNAPTKGCNSTITFSNGSITPIIAWGGGSGSVGNGRSFGIAAGTGGSGGGGSDYPTGGYGQNNSNYNNFGNFGTAMISVIAGGGNTSGAGGGAGTTSYNGTVGGNGIQCFLPGISTFAPSGIAYGTYYWGGGGGANIFPASGAAINVLIGNGGLGGGGGGSITNASLSANQVIPQGGGNALNSGGNGSYTTVVGNANAGSGGANTGGGGGGTAYGLAGAGGSGIVVLAFPDIAVATDASAMLTPQQLLDASNIPVMNNSALSATAYQSVKGAFACKLVNLAYFGPTMTLRYSTDACGNYTKNFYADVYGNLFTGYGNTGTSVKEWLSSNASNTTYAYVTKWYNQGMDICFNSATQYVLGSQPIYEVANQVINFGYTGGSGGSVVAPQTNAFLNLPNGALPYGDASYSYTVRHGNTTWASYGGFVSGGINAVNYGFLIGYGANSGTYQQEWNGTKITNLGTIAINNVVSAQYTSTGNTTSNYWTLYTNGTQISTANSLPGYIRIQTIGNNGIGGNIAWNTPYCNAQFYNVYYFSNAISSSDRLLLENTPYVASTAMTAPTGGHAVGFIPPPAGSIFTISNIAYSYPLGGTFVNGTSVSNGITYNVYSFTAVGGSYTISYSLSTASYIYVLAVGGGGSGGSRDFGSGGGAGGVVMNSVWLLNTSNTITVTVGAGGAGVAYSSSSGSSNGNVGSNTSVSFNANTSLNITAWGGGYGAPGYNTGVNAGGSGGSGGGGTSYSGGAAGRYPPGLSISLNNNFGNQGGIHNATGNSERSAGGGGAGITGNTTSSYTAPSLGIGGAGIQCFLPGIRDFNPSGTAYGSYYWGGGGGGGGGGAGGGGGGGGGGGAGAIGGGAGGSLALNPGGNAYNDSVSNNVYNPNNGGSGGANTGGGGGGGGISNSSQIVYGGAGGSGIVVIAFPQTAVTSNAQAVLTPVQIASGAYNDVLSNDISFGGTKTTSLSPTAYKTIRGAYACRLINYNYFGPIMTLRHSADLCGNYTVNFYADVCGNMGTGYLGTGTSLYTWLYNNSLTSNASVFFAYVTKWYDQGMDISFSSATQYALGYQPIYDVSNGLINFGYTGTALGTTSAALTTGCYFNLPNGALPYGDASYTYTTGIGYTNLYASGTQNVYGTIVGGGTSSASRAFSMEIINNIYNQEWYSNGGFSIGSYTSTTRNVVLSYQYTSGGAANSVVGFFNSGVAKYIPSAPGVRVQDVTYNAIGANINWSNGPFNGQMYYLYVFQNAINPSDRGLIETTPYNYALIPSVVYPPLPFTNVKFSYTISYSTLICSAITITWNGATALYAPITNTFLMNGSSITPTSLSTAASGITTATFSGLSLTTLVYRSFSMTVSNSAGSVNYSDYLTLTDFVNSTVSYNSLNYSVYSFNTVGITYTLTYTSTAANTVYIFAVGGGGAGGSQGKSAGGGAGGVIQTNFSLPAASNASTIEIRVGLGGGSSTRVGGRRGTTTCISFNTISTYYAAYGGGGSDDGADGGSGAGGGTQNGSVTSGGTALYTGAPYYNQGNGGGSGGNYGNNDCGGGGGGAGGGGGSCSGGSGSPTGGAGVQMNGNVGPIQSWSPNGTAYSSYYWAGGGGGWNGTNNANGGSGGGGAGGAYWVNPTVTRFGNGGSALFVAPTGAGAPNSGGGGGGSSVGTYDNNLSYSNYGISYYRDNNPPYINGMTNMTGGSGIAILAFHPSVTIKSLSKVPYIANAGFSINF